MAHTARVARAVRVSRAAGMAVTLWLAGCAVSSGAASADVAAAPVDQASVDQAAALASTCSGCHRAGGSAIVDLQAYSAPRIEQLLLAYKHSADGPTAMHRMARGYSDAEIALIARRLGK
jgi:sulfide dehydrogenase cytochrome subunit